jgi:drug/metabolite transporter (DMT)-like permease
MWLLAALGTTFCFGVNNTLFKWGTTRKLSKEWIQFFFYLVAFLLVLSYGVFRHALHPNYLAFLIGGLTGILNANGNLQMTKAFEKGPASITSTLIAMNSVVVVLATALFFPESIPVLHWLGIVIMIVSAIVVQYQPGNKTRFEYKPWLLRCTFSLVSVGSVGVLLKVAAYEQINFIDMLFFMYGGGLIFLSVLVRGEILRLTAHKSEIKIATIVGFLSTIGFACYLFALKTGPASIVFPIISLNCLVVMISGLFLFKERLKTYQLIGMATALFGLVLTKI